MKFNKLEIGIYLLITDVFNTKENLKGHEYDDEFRAFHVLVGDETDPINIVFSSPKNSNDCYVMITDGDPEKLAREVAALQEYNENNAHLCNGHTVPTDNPYLNKVGWSSYLITTPKITYAKFPSIHKIESREIRFHLALPITSNERAHKIEHGLEKLFDNFENSNRDTITYQQSA